MAGGRRPGRPPLADVSAVRPFPTPAEATAAEHLAVARQMVEAARTVLAAVELTIGGLATAPLPVTARSADPSDPRWASMREAAAHLHVAPSTLRALLAQAGPRVRRNSRVREIRVSLADLDQWVAEEDA